LRKPKKKQRLPGKLTKEYFYLEIPLLANRIIGFSLMKLLCNENTIVYRFSIAKYKKAKEISGPNNWGFTDLKHYDLFKYKNFKKGID
jgi:hypothetical protein